MSAVDTALAEVQAAITAMAPAHEGLRDYALLDLKPETKAVVDAEIARYDLRLSWLLYVEDALMNLVDNGYPTLAPAEIPEDAMEDLQENKSTIDAALGIFRPNTAVGMSLTGGEAEKKTG